MSGPTARTNAVYIREMELEDLPTVFALGERMFTAEAWPTLYRTWDEYELVDMFASEGETCLVAESEADGRLLGFALGTVIEKRRSAWTYGYLVWLAVAPEARRLGVGRRLTEKMTDVFIELGARMMLVDTEADNRPAIDFFRTQGFGSVRNHVYMSRNLTRTASYRRRRSAASSRRTGPRPGADPTGRPPSPPPARPTPTQEPEPRQQVEAPPEPQQQVEAPPEPRPQVQSPPEPQQQVEPPAPAEPPREREPPEDKGAPGEDT